MEKIRVFTAFSGYDSQCLSLDRLKKKYPDFDYELVGWAEIDKYAIQAHNAIYPQWADRNYGDISKINWDEVPDFDLFTYSFPCTDISIVGNKQGFVEGSGTHSSLLWECRRAIVEKKPKVLLMENVPNLISMVNITLFNKWQEELSKYGYINYPQLLDAQNFGIPQSRERLFVLSVRESIWYNSPQSIKLKHRLCDILQDCVEDKYYLSDSSISLLLSHAQLINRTSQLTDKVICLTVKKNGSQPRLQYRVYDSHGISPCLNCCQGGNLQPKVLMPDGRIRKLTPRECFRLMDVDENVIDIIQAAGISNSQQYKLAGNSIVVACLEKIFEQMFFPQYTNSRTLFG